MIFARSALLVMLLLFGRELFAQVAEPATANVAEPVSIEVSAEHVLPDSTTIDAQRLEVYLDREMRAFGDAEIHRDGQVISGDRIDYNTINHEIHATGNVRLQQGDTRAEGPELRLKMDEREGEMTEPIFHLGGDGEKKSRGNASTILFEGPTRERLKSARYTTCEDGRDDWFLRAGELEIDHHSETATATNASIEFKGVPILYTPWIDFPFNNQRKSGFLTPTFGSTTRSGFEFMLPYYWNIAPNMDATLAPRYLGKRGLQWQGEYRYLESDFQGIDSAEYLPSDDQTGKNRFYVNLKHDHQLGQGWSGGIKFERVSDDQYFSDMSTRVAVTSRVNLPQQANLRYDSADWHFSALAQQYQTLDKVSYPYQRIPQIALSGFEELGPVDAKLWSEFVRFDKDSQATAVLNHVKVASAPPVTGNRFTLYPSLSVPLTQTFGYITPKFGVHYTNYGLNNGTTFDNSSRTLPIFTLDSGMYFDRDMRIVKNRYTQTLEPRLFYVYIPHQKQEFLPNFDTGLSDLNLATIFAENQFVGGDRVNDANQVTLALTSRLIDQKTGVQRLSATIGERFYFSDQNVTACAPNSLSTDAVCTAPVRTSLHSDMLAALTLNLINHWYADAAWQYNTDIDRTIKGNIATRYQPEPGKVLNMAYRYTRDSLEQIDLSSEWPLGGNWFGLGRLNYSLRDNPPTDRRGPVEYLAGLEYDAGCWQGRAVVHRLATATASSNYALFFQLELGGLSKIGSNPLDVLKRNIPGYANTSLVPDDTQ